MDASQVLWEKWQEQVKGLFPKLHGHQQKLLALIVAGMVDSGCAVLQRVAEDIQQQGWSEAKMSSIERRLERFVANDQVVVSAAVGNVFGPGVAVLEREEAGVCAGLYALQCAVQHRLSGSADPLADVARRLGGNAGAGAPGRNGNGTSWHGCSIQCMRSCQRQNVRYWLTVDWPEHRWCAMCQQRKWHYVLRICQEHTCRRQMGKKKQWSGWCSFKSFIHKKGQQWYGRAYVWQEETIEAYVSACWQETYNPRVAQRDEKRR